MSGEEGGKEGQSEAVEQPLINRRLAHLEKHIAAEIEAQERDGLICVLRPVRREDYDGLVMNRERLDRIK